MKWCSILFILLMVILLHVSVVRADSIDDINRELSNLKSALDSSQKATATNEKELNKLNAQLTSIKNKVAHTETEIIRKDKEVKEGEQVLAYQKNILNQRARSYYKNLNKNSVGVIEILITDDLTQSVQNFFYQKTLQDEDRRTIIKIVLYIKDLEDKKNSLQSEKERLDVVKQEVDKQSRFLSGEVIKSKRYEGELQQKIAVLSAKQQALIAQKLASLNIPRSAGVSMGGCVNDRDIDPGFSPRLAFFTYGVPNRVGLSQWGAYGRAKAGQSEEEILRAYYDNFELKKDYDTGININVEGYGSFNIEDYVKRIYEVPESWDIKALKAQAIAARSYALAYTNNGQGSICATDHCQVFKAEPKGGQWETAVNETRGWVMVQGGSPVKAWFSSTHGGYVLKSSEVGWSDTSWTKHAQDTTSPIASLAELNERAYDRESPWFYCDWGSRAQYNKTAWLRLEEVADIANVILLVKRDSSIGENLYQPDKPNPAGKESWGADRVRQELRSRGGQPFNTVSDASISLDFNGGRTTAVTISGDAGSQTFDSKEFKDFFNLRAPANIQIVGPLYNIEKR